VNVQCKDGQMEIGIEAAEQLGICRLDNDYEMKWRSRRYVFAITQVKGDICIDPHLGMKFLVPSTSIKISALGRSDDIVYGLD
ncbi:unnamed protein product, partial [Symbiodinium pilosum]